MKQLLFISSVFFSLLLAGCAKDENNNEASTPSQKISIAGIIFDDFNEPVSGAVVQLGSSTTVSNSKGFYSFQQVGVSSGRNNIKASKDGYWSHTIGFQTQPGKSYINNIRLNAKVFDKTLNSTTGGTISVAGSSIIFPTNAFITSGGTTYNGTVKLAIRKLYTTDPDFASSVPGGDLLAIDQNGESKILISYGMLGVEIQDPSGNPLQLAAGKTATISLPIASTQLAGAPATIPLWYFDETEGIWKEEGTATKQGNNYVGTVSHFTWWNCDYSNDQSTIEGYVKDCLGNPIPGATVNAGNGYYLMTNQDGYYYVNVPTGLTLQLSASYSNFVSTAISFTATSSGTLYTLQDLIIPCTGMGFVSGNVVDCEADPINGYIIFYNSSFQPITLPILNGAYSGLVPGGASVTYFATATSGYTSGNIQILNVPDTTFMGPLTLCSTGSPNPSDTLFTCNFISPTFGTFNLYETELSYTVQLLPDYFFDIQTTGMIDTIVGFEGDIPVIPGQYTNYNNFIFEITINNNTIDVIPNSGTITVSQMNAPTNSYAFSFSGNCFITDSIQYELNIPVNFTYRLNY